MARTDEPIKVKNPKAKVKDPKKVKNPTTGRDVPLPTTGEFDPADYNKDGTVSPHEQKKYNKYLIAKAKGKAKVKKITEKSQMTPEQKAAKKAKVLKNIGTATASVLSTAASVKGLIKK